jgi:hypothetical protein
MIINKKTYYRDPSFVATGKGLHTLEWIKLNGEKETEILRLKGKVENFVSLHLL